MIRPTLFCKHLQCFLEITFQAAADTPAVDLTDLNAGFLEETSVNADLSVFIFHQDNFLPVEDIFK